MSKARSMKNALILAVVVCTSFVSSAYALSGWVTVDVIRSQVIGNGALGGCLVKVAPNFASLGLTACNDRWVTFDCAARGSTPKDAAMRAFDSAMVAYALGRQLRILVTDNEVIDGFCLGARVVLLPDPSP